MAKGDNAEKAKGFREKHKLTFPVVADPEKKTASMFTSGIIPFNVVADKEGKITYAAAGAKLEKVKEAVDAALKAGGAPEKTGG